MLPNFQLASGSVAGREHRKGVPRNNQDALCVRTSNRAITAFVADGCGSSPQSEFGAIWAVNAMNTLVHRYLDVGYSLDEVRWGRIKQDLVSRMQVLAGDMNPSLSQAVNDFFLFTLVGVVITEQTASFVAIGDGIVVINGEVIVLESNEGNAPPYLGYALTGSDKVDDAQLNFKVVRQLPTSELQHFLCATDGAGDFLARASAMVPGTDKPLGSLEQFWVNDRFFDQTTAVTRRLNVGARDVYSQAPSGRYIIDGGLLSDDTTLVVGRRNRS